MWLLSDEILEKISRDLSELYERAERAAERIEGKWIEMPESIECSACGVDGSRGVERLSGAVLYSISAVSVGDEIREMGEITTLRPHTNVEERIRLHMHTSEFRLGSLAEDELVLIDGSLRGAFVRPAAFTDDPSKLRECYELECFVEDFLEVLDRQIEVLETDLRRGMAKKNYLLTREELFRRMEEGYRRGKGSIEDLMILFEYIEYLHALNRLLEKNAVFFAKTFYTHEFDEEVTDVAVLHLSSLKQFGCAKQAYFPFRARINKTLPWFVKEFRDRFENLFKDFNSAFVRFEEGGNIYMIETPLKIDDELIGKLKSLEVHGYPLPLIHAHRLAKIKRAEMKKAMESLFASVESRFDFLLRSGRDVIEG